MNQADIENLQNSMKYMGDSFLQQEMMRRKQTQQDVENAVEQRKLRQADTTIANTEAWRKDQAKNAADAITAKTAAEKAKQAGKIKTTLYNSKTGNTMDFEGAPDALDAVMKTSEQKGEPLTKAIKVVFDGPNFKGTQYFGSDEKFQEFQAAHPETPFEVTTDETTGESFYRSGKGFKQVTPTKLPTQPTSSASHTDRDAAGLEVEAQMLKQKGDEEGAAKLTERAKSLRGTLPQPKPGVSDQLDHEQLKSLRAESVKATADALKGGATDEQKRYPLKLQGQIQALEAKLRGGSPSPVAPPTAKPIAPAQFPAHDEHDLTALQPTAPARAGFPKPGEIRKGYKFIGGDPAKPESWQKLQP